MAIRGSMAAAIMSGSDAVVGAARAWLGTPYQHQASLRGLGCDCVGLVRGVWRDLGRGRLPAIAPYGRDWAETCGAERLLAGLAAHFEAQAVDDRRTGLVAAFRWRPDAIAKHAAILTAEDRMIHVHEGIVVSEVSLGPWWRRRICGLFSFGD